MEKQNFSQRIQFFIKRKLLERNFSSKGYWDLRYKSHWNSGDGSYGPSAQAKSKVFNQILSDFNIQSVVEFGCGDGHQLQFYNIPKYLGLDVSKTTIQRVSEQHKGDPNKSFMLYDPEAFFIKSEFIKAQMAISVDVIFHLVEQEVFEKYLKDLFRSATDYVAIYATNRDDPQQVAHVKNRKFTDWVEQNIPDWKLSETRPTKSESGETFLDWYIYKRK